MSSSMTYPIVQWMDRNAEAVQAQCPPGWTPEQTRRSVMALMQSDTKGKIAECDPKSLVLTILTAAAHGLNLDTGEAYVIPYNGIATLSIGWKGLVKLAKRGGDITDIEAEVIYESEADDVRMQRATDHSQHGILHPMKLRRSGDIVGAYALITLRSGLKTFEYCGLEEIEAARDQSKAKNSLGWSSFYWQMAKKVVIRRALNRFNLEPAAASLIAQDDRLHSVELVSVGSGLRETVQRKIGESNPDLFPVETAPASTPPPEQSGEPLASDAGASTDADEQQELASGPMHSASQLIRHSEASDEHKAAAREYLAGLDEVTQEEWIQALKDADDRAATVCLLADKAAGLE